jgi:hypothetical protein
MPPASNIYQSNNLKYDLKNFAAISGIGIIIKLFFGTQTSKTGDSGPATAAIWGYGTITLSLVGLLLITIALATKHEGIQNTTFTDSIPLLLIIFVLSWIIGIYMNYYKRINKGDVAIEYYTYSNTSIIFVILQLLLVFNSIRQKMQIVDTKGQGAALNNQIQELLGQQLTSISYLFTLINFIIAGIMQVILEFFTTDG